VVGRLKMIGKTMFSGRILFDVIILGITFPSVVCGLLAIFMVNVLWSDLRELRAQLNASQNLAQGESGGDQEAVDKRPVIGAISIFILLIVYILLIEQIGFQFATILFLFSAMLICHASLTTDAKTMPTKAYMAISAISSVVTTLLVQLLFVQGFGLSLY